MEIKVPAKRLRNDNWRQSLQQVYERGGSIEISMHRPDYDADIECQSDGDECHADEGHDDAVVTSDTNLVWRV
mgnify:CR=1 FL=1